MKKTLLFLLAMVSLLMVVGCISNISQVQNKFQHYGMKSLSDVIEKGESTIYYFYVDYGEGFHSYGWYCWEYTCDKSGNILKKREFWIGKDKALEEFRSKLK